MTAKDVIDFFVKYFEAWRAEMQLTGFYLAGQSMGAYLVGCYAAQYPQHIKKLLLLTPPGVGKKPAEGCSRNWRGFLESDYKPPKIIEKIA